MQVNKLELVDFDLYLLLKMCYLFLQAIKIVNTVKLKEEFDFESLCRKLEIQVDHLTVEIERKQKLREDDKYELEKQLKECQDSFAEAKRNLIGRSEVVVFPIYHSQFS